jgi:uncharacterized protein (DUF1697 family)
MPRYVALLRGINVGGRNPIRMADLKACFEGDGFTDVITYIQSGNVVFGSSGSGGPELSLRIERLLSVRFGYEASVVVRSRTQMRSIVDEAPRGFGADPSRFRSDVIFLKSPMTPRMAMKEVRTREGVDRAWEGSGVLYFQRLSTRASESRLSKIVSSPIYGSVTIRNWATTTKLLDLMSGGRSRAGSPLTRASARRPLTRG